MILPVLHHLPMDLIEERGGSFGFVCIWREGESSVPRHESVGEFLSRPENQSGTWLIDGGWGGPPGPVRVRWTAGSWKNEGFPPWDD